MATERYELYDGKVILEFDEAKHRYTLNKKWVPGVTGVTGIIDNDKSGRLMGWAVKMVVEYLQAHLKPGKLLSLVTGKWVAQDEVNLHNLFGEAKGAHRRKTQHAADVGTFVHNWVEQHIKAKLAGTKGPELPDNPAVLSGVNAFLGWEAQHTVHYTFSERRVASVKYFFAGTVDIVAEVDGKLCVVDIKTSNYLNDEFWLQTAAYVIALEEEFEEVFDDRIIVRLGKEGGEFDPHSAADEGRDFEKDKAAFVAARAVYAWAKEKPWEQRRAA